AFQKYLTKYVNSEEFISLKKVTKKLIEDLKTIKYCIQIKGSGVKVRKYENEPDYSMEVVATFEKFKQGAVKDYLVKFTSPIDMNHVEARILELVAQLYSDIFINLDNYYIKNKNFFDETINTFDREVQFYIAYSEYMTIFKNLGLNFCYPIISNQTKEIYNYDGFDLALAYKLINENSKIVCNDFYLKDRERIFIVSGPNQGGKTTFARMFGQLHYLATLGCPVPGRNAQLYLFDKLFTHFEKEENIRNLHGKLQDDLISIYNILSQASPNSIVILNEIFNSTTLKDAIFLGKKIMEKIIQLDLLCVYVTFIDELASLSEKIVSMVSNVDPNNIAMRTYKILRKAAGGLAYAISIAQKYQLTYEALRERIKS
ncbi:MAG: DNA mismatch repair protein MutS, partial [Actinobacteria bacterium]|nr:DNA mismatch repair protein MutS [Actinomycetota bacterium]